MAKKKRKEKKFNLFTKGSVDYIILSTVIFLVACGLVMILSASSPTALSETGDSYKYVKRQAVAAIFGIVFMIGFSMLDYHIYRKLKWIIYIGFIALLIFVGLFGISAGRSKTLDNYCRF